MLSKYFLSILKLHSFTIKCVVFDYKIFFNYKIIKKTKYFEIYDKKIIIFK